MQIIKIDNWREFRDHLMRFAILDRGVADDFWFRGQSSVDFSLRATLDRGRTFAHTEEREVVIKQLLDEFARESLYCDADQMVDGQGLELLARHHGLPSPWIDWTRSPWVASFFAAQGARTEQLEPFAVLAVRRSSIPKESLEPVAQGSRPKIELLDEPTHVRLNRRAVRQRGAFMRVSTAGESLEDLLGASLYRFEIPTSEAEAAMLDLDQMLINATTLMGDLDGAAATATRRINRSRHEQR